MDALRRRFLLAGILALFNCVRADDSVSREDEKVIRIPKEAEQGTEKKEPVEYPSEESNESADGLATKLTQNSLKEVEEPGSGPTSRTENTKTPENEQQGNLPKKTDAPKNNAQEHDGAAKRQIPVQAQRLKSLLRDSDRDNGEPDWYEIFRAINRTVEGKQLLLALRRSLNESPHAREQLNNVHQISQTVRTSPGQQLKLEQIFALYTPSLPRQWRLIEYGYKPIGKLIDSDQTFQMREILSRIWKTEVGQIHLKQLTSILEDGVSTTGEILRARRAVHEACWSSNNVGAIQRKQLEQILSRQIQTLQGQANVLTVLEELREMNGRT